MSSYKNVNSDYTLTCDNGSGLFTINARTVFTGDVTFDVPAVTVSPFLTVAANNTGSLTNMGLLAQLSPTGFAGLRFSVAANTWQISSSVDANGAPVAAYVNLATGNALVGGANTEIQFNDAGSLAGNARLTFNKTTAVVTLAGTQVLGNTAIPATPANAVALFSNVTGPGGTGLYVLSDTVSDELVSKSKAIVYSIIF